MGSHVRITSGRVRRTSPNGIRECATVVPVPQRSLRVLPRRVVAAQVPDVGDAERREIAQPFRSPNQAQRRPRSAPAWLPPESPLVMKITATRRFSSPIGARQIRSCQRVIVRMRDQQENIRFQAVVGFLRAPGARGLCGESADERGDGDQDDEREQESAAQHGASLQESPWGIGLAEAHGRRAGCPTRPSMPRAYSPLTLNWNRRLNWISRWPFFCVIRPKFALEGSEYPRPPASEGGLGARGVAGAAQIRMIREVEEFGTELHAGACLRR